MKQKKTFIILGAIGLVVFVVFWVVVLIVAVKTLRDFSTEKVEIPIVEATLCSEDNSNLCVINFGTNSLNRMVIHFQTPGKGYDSFYVKAKNRDTVSVYTCEVDEVDLTVVHCTGLRTPLGETIDLEVYTTDGDLLFARGTFLVSAVAIPTPISMPSEVPTEEPTVTEEPFTTEEPFITEEPFVTEQPFSTEEPFPTQEPFTTEEATPPPDGESTPDPFASPSP